MRNRTESRMITRTGVVSIIAIVAFLCSSSVSMAQKLKMGKNKVRVVSLKIGGEGYAADDDLQINSMEQGTKIKLLITNPDAGFISMNKDKSKIIKFVDDKGKNLLVKPEFGQAGFSSWPKFSDDGNAVMIGVEGKPTPSKGAKEIHILGIATFKSGSQKKTFTQKNLSIAPNTKINCGPIPLTISETGKPSWGDEPLEITIHADQKLDKIAKIRFLDESGEEIETSGSGGCSMTMGSMVSVDKEMKFAKKVTEATIEITYWMDLKDINVPLNLKVSLGL